MSVPSQQSIAGRARLASIPVLALVLALAAPCPGQSEPAARGWFIEDSRPKKPMRSRPRPSPSGSAEATSKPARAQSGGSTRPTSALGSRIGLGWTLFKKRADGVAVVANPRSVFVSGTRLRLQIEPSIDGYLYVFATENEANPSMLYPDARLSGGSNAVEAHTVVEVPSRDHPEYRWFELRDGPATEQLYIVVARDPLPGVPSHRELQRHSRNVDGPWRPSEETWTRIRKLARPVVASDLVASADRPQTLAEERALAREVVLSSEDASPTAVVALERARIIATIVEIRHE